MVKKKKTKNLPANAGDVRDVSSVPGLGRSPGEGYGKPLQYSCLENPVDRGAWQAAFQRVSKLDITELTYMHRPEFTGSNSWLKGDERSVGDDNDEDHTGDDSKHLTQ